MAAGVLPAQEYNRTLEVYFDEQAIVVTRFADRVEAVPILELIGAEVKHSLSSGTYGVVYGPHVIQFGPDLKVLLVNGELKEATEKPVASPGGIAVSLGYLDRNILSPLGFHLEPEQRGYRIHRGARFLGPVTVRAAAADFDATTTLVLTLSRSAEVTVEEGEPGTLVVRFEDSAPQLDGRTPFRSNRVRRLLAEGQTIEIQLASNIGLLAWHAIDGPPRITIELGRARPTPTPAPARAPVIANTGPRPIVIDPGHGGDDLGAQSPDGVLEKDLTLAVSRRLARVLERKGYAVRLTRDGDQHRAHTDRTSLANRLDARVFVSLHANASTHRSVTGAETFYMSLDGASDAASAALAAIENEAAGVQENRSTLDLILWDLAQAEVLNESAKLALAVQDHLNRELDTRDRGVKQAPFVVLTGATMPAILVEMGFLSNRNEAAKMLQPDYQQQVAEAIAAGIEDFVRR
jgi:N-acetylmuramoyl-L-alanine amidase